MSHNPEKNKALCVIAKGSMWGLRGLLALSLTFFAVVFVAGIAIKLRRDFDWTELWKGVTAILILCSFSAFILAVWWLIGKWYVWAKNYSKDC